MELSQFLFLLFIPSPQVFKIKGFSCHVKVTCDQREVLGQVKVKVTSRSWSISISLDKLHILVILKECSKMVVAYVNSTFKINCFY